MSIYIVRMEHPAGDLWNKHVLEHVEYLKELIAQGRLLASGPLKGTPLRAGFLIMRAENREEIEVMVKGDPFSREDLICGITIEEWDPLFGMLVDQSSRQLPAE